MLTCFAASWFIGALLRLSSAGCLATWPAAMPPFDRIQDIRVDLVNADAHQSPTVAQVREIRAAYHLVVIDVDASVAAKLQLLRLWAPLVAAGGTMVLEDMTTPECADPAANVSMELDRFLLDHPSFGILPQARRFPAGKSTRAVYRRYR